MHIVKIEVHLSLYSRLFFLHLQKIKCLIFILLYVDLETNHASQMDVCTGGRGGGVPSCFSDEEVQMRPNFARPKKAYLG